MPASSVTLNNSHFASHVMKCENTVYKHELAATEGE